MSDSPFSVGARFGDRYAIAAELGAGGMGVVFRARDERLGRDVAVKVLPESAVGDAQARRRLVREARAAAGLEHPSIVHVYDVGETPGGGAYFVMELVKGTSLRDHISARTLSPRKRLAAIVEVGRALAFAHARGFVHRDVKPDNVMIRDDGHAVVLDFGLAKGQVEAAIADAATVTAKGTFVGTPAYMPPEQARGEIVDAAADQFALAVTAFEAAADALPWRGTSAFEIVSEILKGEPRRLREIASHLPAPLEEALGRGLAKSAADRFPTMDAFVDAIEAAVTGVEDGAPPATPSHGLAHAPTIAASVSGAVAPAARASGPRIRASLAAAMSAALAVAGVVGWRALHVAPAPSPSPPARGAPLAAAQSTLACPGLVATAHDFARAEWLGVAAAHLVCERAAIVLGSPARTLVPAELLGLARSPSVEFPKMPWDHADGRDRMVLAAAQADAWIDGRVDRKPDGFHVALMLRSKAGAEISRGEGVAVTLGQAVAAAMSPMLESGAIPRATDARWLAGWVGGAAVEAALALHDLHVAVLEENTDAIRAACDELRPRGDLGGMRGYADALCADRLGEPLPPRPPPDTSTLAATATSASTLRLYEPKTDADRATLLSMAGALEAGIENERDVDARALRAAVAAEVHYALGDPDGAQRWALASIQASPKEVDVRGTAWHRASFTTRDNGAAGGVLASHVGWLPWEPFALHNAARITSDPATEREGAHRAAAIAMRGYWLVAYGETLLESGDGVGASAIAAEAHSASLTVRVLRADGRLRGALAEATSELAKLPSTVSASFEAARLAREASELADILEQPPAHLDDFVARFITADPPPFSRGATPLIMAMSACLLARSPVGARCVTRLAELFRAGHFGAGYVGTPEAVAGAERFAAGDYAGATKAWRLLMSRSNAGIGDLREPIAEAFDRTGDPDFADRVDAPALDDAAPPSLALARAAERAARRHDCATARRLALRLVEKWDVADEKPPVVDRMKKLASRCPG